MIVLNDLSYVQYVRDKMVTDKGETGELLHLSSSAASALALRAWLNINVGSPRNGQGLGGVSLQELAESLAGYGQFESAKNKIIYATGLYSVSEDFAHPSLLLLGIAVE